MLNLNSDTIAITLVLAVGGYILWTYGHNFYLIIKLLKSISTVHNGRVGIGIFGVYTIFSWKSFMYRLQVGKIYKRRGFEGRELPFPKNVLILESYYPSNISFAIEKYAWGMQIKRAFSWSRVIRYQNIPSRTSYHIITKDRKLALQLTEIEVFNQEVDHLFKNGFERIDCTEKSIRIFKFDYRLEDLNVDFIFNYLEHLVKIREALFPK